MAHIRFVKQYGSDDCEDCGSYDWSETEMYVDGVLKQIWTYDNHLAGGLPFDSFNEIKSVLKSLGYTVSTEETYIEES